MRYRIFSALINKKIDLKKINADIHYFVHFMFLQNENLKQSRIKHFLKRKQRLISIPQNHVTLHVIPSKRDHIISPLDTSKIINENVHNFKLWCHVH